eukprot:1116763-Prymnesium_polylepis.1
MLVCRIPNGTIRFPVPTQADTAAPATHLCGVLDLEPEATFELCVGCGHAALLAGHRMWIYFACSAVHSTVRLDLASDFDTVTYCGVVLVEGIVYNRQSRNPFPCSIVPSTPTSLRNVPFCFTFFTRSTATTAVVCRARAKA